MKLIIALPDGFTDLTPRGLNLVMPDKVSIPNQTLIFIKGTAEVTITDAAFEMLKGKTLSVRTDKENISSFRMPDEMPKTALKLPITQHGAEKLKKAESSPEVTQVAAPAEVTTAPTVDVPAKKETPPSEEKKDSKGPEKKGLGRFLPGALADTPLGQKVAPGASTGKPKPEKVEALMTASDHEKAAEKKKALEKKKKEIEALKKGGLVYGIILAVVILVVVVIWALLKSPAVTTVAGSGGTPSVGDAFQTGSFPLLFQIMGASLAITFIIAILDRALNEQLGDLLGALIGFVLYQWTWANIAPSEGFSTYWKRFVMTFVAGLVIYIPAFSNIADMTSPGLVWLSSAAFLAWFGVGGFFLRFFFPTGTPNIDVVGLNTLFKSGSALGINPIPTYVFLGFLLLAGVHFFVDMMGWLVKKKKVAPQEKELALLFAGIFVGGYFLVPLMGVGLGIEVSKYLWLFMIAWALLLSLIAVIPAFLKVSVLHRGGGLTDEQGRAISLASLDAIAFGSWIVLFINFVIG